MNWITKYCKRPNTHRIWQHYGSHTHLKRLHHHQYTHTTPGMSDHEAVTFEVNLNPIRNRKPPHKVFKYKSADWFKLKNEISKLTDGYFDTDPNSQDVNTNWTFFNLTILMNNTIPNCNTKAKKTPSMNITRINKNARKKKQKP